jgi:peptide chain release factor 1
MDGQVLKLAEETLGRYEALTRELSDPNIFTTSAHYAEVAKEHSRMRRGAEMSRSCSKP